MSSETLSQWLTGYCLERDLSRTYSQQLRLSIQAFERFAGPVVLAELTDDLANRWLVRLAESGRSKETVKTQRRNLLVVWRDAYAAGRAPEPKRVRLIKCPRTLPEAWSMAQMQSLLEAAEKQPGRFRRSLVRKAAFWRALVLVIWDTGLRLGDLVKIKLSDIGSDGSMVVVQSKTGWPVLCKLSPEAVAAVEATFPPARELVFGGVLCRHEIFDQFRALADSVGLRGGTKKIRKSSATAVEAVQPGAASRHLGHQSAGLAAKHYIDPRLLPVSKVMPPRIA